MAPNIELVLVGWCIAQLFFNALLAAEVTVLPDQVPAVQRGLVAGVLGVCVPIASVAAPFLVGTAISGLGSGMYVAADLALVVDVLPDRDNAAKDLGVFNMAGALPFSIAPGIAPAILAIGGGSYGVLYGVAGVCAIIGAVAILPVKRVR